MPYIKQDKRDTFNNIIATVARTFNFEEITPGDLNYIITKITHLYIEKTGVSYTKINDIIGVLESAKAEFQRRVVAPYEDLKIKENGDI